MAQQAASAPLPPATGPAPADKGPPSARLGARTTRHTYGALDLGTNNCRLLIARPSDDGFTVIDAFSRVVRLGEGLAASGRISDAAQDRAIAALAVCADKLCRRRVTLARSVATEACRRAANGRHFIERVRRETGIVLEIISPEEEARLAMLGCHRLLEPGDGPALIFDIGGGSTELVLVDTDGDSFRVIDAFSRIVRLGEGLAASGRLSAAAVDRSIEALKVCRDKMRARGVTRSRLIATEAARAAENGADFIARVHEETGLELEIIDRATEARLAAAGCSPLVDPPPMSKMSAGPSPGSRSRWQPSMASRASSSGDMISRAMPVSR